MLSFLKKKNGAKVKFDKMNVPKYDESSEKKVTRNRPLNMILWKTLETFQQNRQFLVIDAKKWEEF